MPVICRRSCRSRNVSIVRLDSWNFTDRMIDFLSVEVALSAERHALRFQAILDLPALPHREIGVRKKL